MISLKAQSIALVCITMLISGSAAHYIRCSDYLNTQNKQEKKCFLSASQKADFTVDDPNNLDLGLDTSKPTYIYLISLFDNPTAEKEEDVLSVKLINLSNLVKKAQAGSSAEDDDNRDCSLCFHNDGKPNPKACLNTPKDYVLSKSPLNAVTDIKVSFVFCKVSSKVVYTKEAIAESCPKSVVTRITPQGTTITRPGKDDLVIGFTAIRSCSTPANNKKLGFRFYERENSNGKPDMDVCAFAGEHHSYTDTLDFDPNIVVTEEVTKYESGSVSPKNYKTVYPAGSPVFFSFLTCGARNNKQPDLAQFRLAFNVPLTAYALQCDLDVATSKFTTQTFWDYLGTVEGNRKLII